MTERWNGPWRYTGDSFNDYGGRFHEIVDATGDAVIGEFGGPHSADLARLIAASPALYDALTEANAFILAPAEDVREHVLSRIRAVLSLARGESAS